MNEVDLYLDTYSDLADKINEIFHEYIEPNKRVEFQGFYPLYGTNTISVIGIEPKHKHVSEYNIKLDEFRELFIGDGRKTPMALA